MRSGKAKAKIKKVMHEFHQGELRSGSKSGPVVSSSQQAMAIAMSEAGMSKRRDACRGRRGRYACGEGKAKA